MELKMELKIGMELGMEMVSDPKRAIRMMCVSQFDDEEKGRDLSRVAIGRSGELWDM